MGPCHTTIVCLCWECSCYFLNKFCKNEIEYKHFSSECNKVHVFSFAMKKKMNMIQMNTWTKVVSINHGPSHKQPCYHTMVLKWIWLHLIDFFTILGLMYIKDSLKVVVLLLISLHQSRSQLIWSGQAKTLS